MEDSREYLRQLDIIRPEQLAFPVLVLGLGTIGSWTALSLAKLGCRNLTLIDNDVVELKNLPNQFYKRNQIGLDKTIALGLNIQDVVGFAPSIIQSRYPCEVPQTQVIVCSVDSLEERRRIWTSMKDKVWDLYIDARMAEDTCRIYAVTPATADKYEKSLFAPRKPLAVSCSARSVVYLSLLCASVISQQITKYAKFQEVAFEQSFVL